jgi:uncharacterized membrane protein HdeD (DUF308 family)
MASFATCILLYGGLALASGLGMDRRGQTRSPFLVYGAVSILLGVVTLIYLIANPLSSFGPPENLYIYDDLDGVIAAWGTWALMTGRLLLVLASDPRLDDSRHRLAAASVTLLILGLYMVLASIDLTDEEDLFIFWVGALTIAAGAFHILFASALRSLRKVVGARHA